MRMVAIAVFSFIALAAQQVNGASLARPLASPPTPSAWFDNDRLVNGSHLRYDSSTIYSYDGHWGIDFPKPTGTLIYSAAAATIYACNNSCYEQGDPLYDMNCGSQYGNYVRLQHGNVTIYAHMKRGTARCLASILCGVDIGQVGLSGKTTGPHLHFEVRGNTTSSAVADRFDAYGGSANGFQNLWRSYNSPSSSNCPP